MNEKINLSESSDPLAAVELEVPPKLQPSPPPGLLPPWLKRFLACNPFYLVSAALLLYGLYGVSVGPNFLSQETSQLFFKFTSLQGYEILVVLTAIFLARRRIWYDATLLVGLENLLVLVPFILISQAALIDRHWIGALCLAGGLLALARFSGLKRLIRELNVPGRLAWTGLVLLLVNVALPVVYRMLHETKVGTKPTWGAAYETNEYAWILFLPALCALALVLPPARATGALLLQRRWLPLGLFSLWLAGTGMHLYCLGYVYDFSLRQELLAPVLWVLLWTGRQRATDLYPEIAPNVQRGLLVPPLLVTVLATSQPGNEVFLMLTILNIGIYAGLCFYQRGDRLALHLLLISLVALIGGLPEDWGRSLVSDFSRSKCLGAGAAAYFLLWAALSRNPKLGVLGALVASAAVAAVWGTQVHSVHWAVQAGLIFVLVHSLRWADADHPGAGAARILASALWVIDAFVWMHSGGAAWMACALAGPVLGAYAVARWLGGNWGPLVVPLAAVMVLLSGPGHGTAEKLQAAPTGLLAILGSFLLFGLGTVAALTRQHWNKTDTHI